MTKSTYNVGGVGGLGLDSRLEIDVEPTRNWKFSKLMRVKVMVYGNKIDNYAVTAEKIAKSAETSNSTRKKELPKTQWKTGLLFTDWL